MKTVKIIALLFLVASVGIQFIPTKLNQSEYILKTDFLLVNKTPKSISRESHIQEGKKELDFSKWAEYSNRRKKSKLKSIMSQIRDNKMPLSSYTFIHSDAKLTKKEKKNITDFMNKILDSL